MNKGLITAAMAAALVITPTRELSAQPWQAGLPGDDMLSVGVHLGAVSPTTTLTDGTKYSGGIGGGISATYWASRYIGLRANYELAKTEGNNLELASASQENPTVSFFGGELDFRYPVRTGGAVALAPFVGAGVGGKQYDWSKDSTGVDLDLVFAWNLTGGLHIRPVASPWVGVLLEAKRYSSKYRWHAMQWDPPTMSDLLFSVGITLNR